MGRDAEIRMVLLCRSCKQRIPSSCAYRKWDIYDMKQTSEDSVSIVVNANFHPKQSWLKKGKGTDHLLNHEQRHFDIAEIYRRILIKTILTSGILNDKDIAKDLDKVYLENDTALREYQSKYDDETEHSQRLEIQKKWNVLIDDQLAELEEYNTHEITDRDVYDQYSELDF